MSNFQEQDVSQFVVVSEPEWDPNQLSDRVALFDEEGNPYSSGIGVTVLLRAPVLDIHLTGGHDVKWNAVKDNQVDENVLSSLPAGLGLDIPIDGSSEICTAEEDGVWYMELYDYQSTIVQPGSTLDLFFWGVAASGTVAVPGQYPRHAAVVPMREGNTFRSRCSTNLTVTTFHIDPALLIVRLK